MLLYAGYSVLIVTLRSAQSLHSLSFCHGTSAIVASLGLTRIVFRIMKPRRKYHPWHL